MWEIAHLASRSGEALMVFGTPFDCPGFAAAGAVGDEIQGDGAFFWASGFANSWRRAFA